MAHRASFEQAGRPVSRRFRLGLWLLDPKTRKVKNGGLVRRLTPKAIGVLMELVDARGEVVTREALMEAVWPDVIVGDEALTHVIAELRRTLNDGLQGANVIETIHKVGYRLDVEIGVEEPGCHIETDGDFDLDAYLLCLEARRILERSEVGSAVRGVDLCTEAVARAPRFALAQAELSSAIVNRRLYYDDAGPSLNIAAEAAAAAVELRPADACGHVALGTVLSALGRHEEARRAFEAALAINVRDFDGHYLFARALFAAGDMPAAARMAEQAATLRSDDYVAPLLALKAFHEFGDHPRASFVGKICADRLRRLLDADPANPRARNSLGVCLGYPGRRHEALEAVERDERTGYPVHFNNVAAFVQAGEISEALSRLEMIVDQGWRHGDWLRFGEAGARLRREPRFRRIEMLLNKNMR